MSALSAIRNKVEEAKEEVIEAYNSYSDTEGTVAIQKLDEIISFIDSLSLDDKLECCQR